MRVQHAGGRLACVAVSSYLHGFGDFKLASRNLRVKLGEEFVHEQLHILLRLQKRVLF